MFFKNKPYSSVLDIISALNLFQSKITITRFLRENNFKCQNPTKKIILTEKLKKTESNSSKQIFQEIGQMLYFLMKKF